MSRILRIIIGLAAIAYAVYSGNNWFYLGAIPLVTGLVNWCPMEKMMGGCKDGNCSGGTCGTSDKNTKAESSCCSSSQEKTSCCATPDEQIAQFTATKPEEKTACCSSSNDKEAKVVIKILGTGCANCIALKKVVDEAIKTIAKECEVLKVEDMQEIMKYQVMSTPGLVINEEVKSVGKLLNIEEVKALINGASEQTGSKIKTKCCGN